MEALVLPVDFCPGAGADVAALRATRRFRPRLRELRRVRARDAALPLRLHLLDQLVRAPLLQDGGDVGGARPKLHRRHGQRARRAAGVGREVRVARRGDVTDDAVDAPELAALGALLVALASFLCYVRARERQGTPIWSRYRDTEKGAGAGGDGASSASSAETEFSAEVSLK